MYLSEISPRAIRGGVGVIFQVTIVVGIILSQVLGFEAILGSEDYWPVLISINIFLGMIQCLSLPFCPESPRFLLITKGDREAGKDSLQWFRSDDADIESELKEMIEEDRQEKAEPPVSYKDLWRIGSGRLNDLNSDLF